MPCIECCVNRARQMRQTKEVIHGDLTEIKQMVSPSEGLAPKHFANHHYNFGSTTRTNPTNRGAPSIEEYELKLYSLSEFCYLVSADKRCHLTTPDSNGLAPKLRTKPLKCLEEGRHYLDNVQCQPETMSKIRVLYDNSNDQVIDREFSVCSIEQDNCDYIAARRKSASGLSAGVELDEEAALEEQQQKQQKLADQLTGSSFVLVERDEVAIRQNPAAERPKNDPSSCSKELATNSSSSRQNEINSLEKDFISSLKIKPTSPLVQSRVDDRSRPQDEWLLVAREQNLTETKRLETRTASEQTPDCHNNKPSSRLNWARKKLGKIFARANSRACSADEVKTTSESYPITMREEISAAISVAASPVASFVAMISYNHIEAREFAIQLHEALLRLGIRTYLDLYDIQSGSDWQDSLNWAILNCRLFIPLVTRSYGETLWTSRECKLADVLAKRIVPIHFEQTSWPPASLAIQFATLQYLNWRPTECQAINKQSSPSPSPSSALWNLDCVESVARSIQKCILDDGSLELSRRDTLSGANSASSTTSSSGAFSCASTTRVCEPTPAKYINININNNSSQPLYTDLSRPDRTTSSERARLSPPCLEGQKFDYGSTGSRLDEENLGTILMGDSQTSEELERSESRKSKKRRRSFFGAKLRRPNFFFSKVKESSSTTEASRRY